MNRRFSRRHFIRYAMLGMSSLAMPRISFAQSAVTNKKLYFDEKHNVALPIGSSIRIVAQSNKTVINNKPFLWHGAPDGGVCFETGNKGWIYVSNSELAEQQGGVSAIKFNNDGEILDAYSILNDTNRNCAGGKTPWNTWLSCEENGELGQVYECDPDGNKAAVVRPKMGSFNHEAVAIDLKSGFCYMTEDVKDGCLYRFIPANKNDLSEGRLEVAVAEKMVLTWKEIADPSAKTIPTRYQIEEAARFKGGEGIIYHDGKVSFTTKKDNIVWQYHIDTGLIYKIYDASEFKEPLLTGVDNIEVSQSGELLIAEDGGNMQIIALDHNYRPHVLVQLYGQDQSEITGPAFSPDGSRLYFSSQRGKTGKSEDGLTYEVTL